MLVGLARTIGTLGLAAIGGVHAAWAKGSSWPAKNHKRLAKAAVGSSKGLPDEQAVAGVAVGSFVGSALAAGAFGEGRLVVGVRRLLGLCLLARGMLGGDAVLGAMGLPPGGKRFQALDERYYRPAATILGIALLIGARSRKADDRELGVS